MATVLEDLEAARLVLSAKILEATENPRVTYNIEDQSFSWSEYMTGLLQQLAELDKAVGRRSKVKVTWVGTTKRRRLYDDVAW